MKSKQEQKDIENLFAETLIELSVFDSSASSQEQSASVQAMERITTDQANELVGRLNAIQIAQYQHLDNNRSILAAVNTVAQNIQTMQGVVSEMRSMVWENTSSLSFIKDFQEKANKDWLPDISNGIYNVKRAIERF